MNDVSFISHNSLRQDTLGVWVLSTKKHCADAATVVRASAQNRIYPTWLLIRRGGTHASRFGNGLRVLG